MRKAFQEVMQVSAFERIYLVGSGEGRRAGEDVVQYPAFGYQFRYSEGRSELRPETQ